MDKRSGFEGPTAEQVAKQSLELRKESYEQAKNFVTMLLPHDWMDSSPIHLLGEIAGINRGHLNEAMNDLIVNKLAERSLSGQIRATERIDLPEEQDNFIKQMHGLLKVREETDEFIAFELHRQLSAIVETEKV